MVCVALAGAALCLGHAPVAAANPSVQVGLSPTSVSFPGGKTLTYTLQVTAGSQDEVFGLSATAPTFPGEGPALDQVAIPTIVNGQGGAFSSVIADFAACSSGGGLHAVGGRGYNLSVKVLAGQTATITWRFGTGLPPWPGMSLAPRFDFQAVGEPTLGPTTLTAPFSVQGPAPVLTGTSGVRILLKTKPRLGEIGVGADPLRRVKIGETILLTGRTIPAVRKQKMLILFEQREHPRTRTLPADEGPH